MKILVMSLLRIGDIVLSTPVLRGLRERYPDAEIHLLINSQFKQIAPLIPYVDRTIPFEREKLQKGLGEASTPLFEPYERLSSFIDAMTSEKYDWAINLTHSRLSGWLMSLIPAEKRTGLCFDGAGQATFGSSWFRYLNSQVDSEGDEVFHFTDVFRFGLDLDSDPSSQAALVETDAGRREAESFLEALQQDSGKKSVVAVQALTSDVKKDWPFERFAQALELFQSTHPKAAIVLLGAPFEKARLEPLIETLRSRGVDAALAILSFEGAFSLLRRSEVLLSGDTSIKHLACAAETRVVEISLGSSDLHRTGAYLHGSVILQSKESCAPCVHSKPCHREKHFCSARISPEVVSMVLSEVYSNRHFQLSTVAEEYKDDLRILKVESRSAGFWAAYDVLEPFAEDTIGRWIDLTSRKLWLEAVQNAGRLSTRGSETRKLARLLMTIHPDIGAIEWRHMMADFEKQTTLIEGHIQSFKVGLQRLKGNYENPERLREFVKGLIGFREKIRHSPLLKSFKASLDQVIEDDISPPFTRFRRISDAVIEIDRRSDIHVRLIRGLAGELDSESRMEKT